ncbi:MAG: hypothetical protein V1780_06070 [Chloroflexota bacterium]
MAQKEETGRGKREPGLDAEQVQRRLDMFDQRLDNLDSMITAVIQRVMNQPVTLNVTCPKCGGNIEIALMGGEKPTR